MQTGVECGGSAPVFAFNGRYLLLALLVFAVELIIAMGLSHVAWVRAYLGDVLVVVLLYTAARSVLCISDRVLLWAVFLFACLVELAQYFGMAERLGFVRGDVMYTVIGNTFSWGDIACYAGGCVLVAGVKAAHRRLR